MKKTSLTLGILLLTFSFSISQVDLTVNYDTPYGENKQTGKYADVNGIKMYYEEYGSGEPMLLIHGNGASIQSMGHQIEFFKKNYRIIVADSRGHGKSELNTDSLTYIQIASDWAALADYLSLDSLHIIGWSDGGIVGLLIGIYHPEKARKIATMGANLRPDSTAVYPWAVKYVKDSRIQVQEQIDANDTSQPWDRYRQLLGLLGDQPQISHNDLAKISAPVLIMAGDKDVIREEHSVEMYQHIPRAQLCIMPGETHFTPISDPAFFNMLTGRFFSEPFKRPDTDWTK